ncbi:MAG: cytochrome b N-terminal domain-containing protein [Deltaproteobacteria bacterium]|nr:cytochrome b N-terminal domain-containing protein [Deltaproteobacteria bacterium]
MSVQNVHASEAPDRSGEGNLLKVLPGRLWRSIFRTRIIPTNELERSKSVSDNFFFHIHSSKVTEHTLKPTTTLGLGLFTLYTFVILVITGVLLMFYYVPTVAEAYDRMLDLRGAVFFGTFLRNLHRWSAHAMVALAVAHMVRVYLTGAHKAPREFNWVVGVILLLLTLFMSFTGYLLPWDQLAYWAIVVGTAIAGYAPLVGDEMRYFLLGDFAVGGEALLRFYVLHVVVLPAVLTTFIGVHFWRIRKDGGLARPKPAPASTIPTPVLPDQAKE